MMSTLNKLVFTGRTLKKLKFVIYTGHARFNEIEELMLFLLNKLNFRFFTERLKKRTYWVDNCVL